MKRYRGYFLDVDGTLICGQEAIKGARAFLEKLQFEQIPFLYLTNNSTRDPDKLADFLRRFSFPVTPEQIYTTSMAVTRYLETHWVGASVYVIGEEGLIQAVEKAGCHITSKHPAVVIVGRDRHFTYEKMSKACQAIAHGAVFLGTSIDRAYPMNDYFLPGSGALIQAIATATRVTPIFMGKPEPTIMEYALERIGLPSRDVLMVGDNLETDIMVGQRMPMDTWLVLTGITSAKMVEQSVVRPTYITTSIEDGVSYLA